MKILASVFQPTVMLALALMAIIVMMILPMPAWVLDMGLATSFALAILIFTITLFIERPLDFSSFPTILLASLMLRLSLNVSSTKLIIGEGHTGTDAAGDVIEGFSQFVMGGNVFLGLVVFGVLLIVNFMVITKGAARMAEVGARFALDGMPGKQLAIDADMSAGAIGHEEAKERREREQLETTFFGSLDGASKFVKGDAIAGLLITFLNLAVGLIMGVAVHGMAFGLAFETYAILTVGDGLVTQIPAVVISIASALLLARGGATGATDLALVAQIGKHPAALGTVGFLMLLFALVPGLPLIPFLLGAAALGTASLFAMKRRKSEYERELAPVSKIEEQPSRSIGDVLDLDDLSVEFAPDLVEMILDPGTGLDARIGNIRNYVAGQFGLILPEIRLTDNPSFPSGQYRILVQGVVQAEAKLYPSRVLVLRSDGDDDLLPDGYDSREPVYGAEARWVQESARHDLALGGMTVVNPGEVLATHLLEVVKQNFSRLFTLKSMRKLLDEMVNLSDGARNEANRKLFDELIPDKVPLDTLHTVLRLLLDEQVSIRNLPLILEAVAEGRSVNAQPEAICEHVRQRLGFQLVSGLKREDGTLPLIQLSSDWEDQFSTFQVGNERSGLDVALPPDVFNKLSTGLAEKVQLASDQGISAAIVTSARRRRFLRTLTKAKGISAPVLSYEEIGLDAHPSLVGVVAA